MQDISTVYMLEGDTKLDHHALSEIIGKGHSRIPVYMKEKACVIGVLIVKNLILIDPADEVRYTCM
jgi:metal transporter CNNM